VLGFCRNYSCDRNCPFEHRTLDRAFVRHTSSRCQARARELAVLFAFVFAAALSLGRSLLDELREVVLPRWLLAIFKVAFFLLSAYLFLRNNWMRNHLAALLGWLKSELRPNSCVAATRCGELLCY